MPTAKKPRKPRKPKAEPSSRGLTAADIAQAPPEAEELARQIAEDGGTVLAAYKDPLKGSGLVLAALPIEQIERTPWQRDLSDARNSELRAILNYRKALVEFERVQQTTVQSASITILQP